MAKPLIIIICVAFLGGALYLGGASFFGGNNSNVVYAAIATVNGEPINEFDFINAYYQQVEYWQSVYGQLDRQMLESIRYHAYDRLVEDVLITQEIESRNIQVPKEEVDAEVAEFKATYPQELLDQYGYTDALIKESLLMQLRFDKLIKEIVGPVEIDEQAIKEQYEAVQASHILIKVDSDDEETWEEAKLQAESVLAELENSDFAELAKTYSDDTSAERGGELGFINRGQTVAPFEEVAFALEVGEVSGLVKSQYGYHIITVTDVKRAEGEEYEKAKVEIKEELEDEYRYEIFSQWLKEKRGSADIVIHDSQLVAISHVMNGDLEAAVVAYEAAIKEEPNDGYLYASMGNVYNELKQLDKALEAYEKATEKQPNDGELFFTLGTLYQEEDQIESAVEAYLKASELIPFDFYAQYTIYAILSNLEAEEAAEIVNERIVEIEAMYAEAMAAQEAENLADEELADEEIENNLENEDESDGVLDEDSFSTTEDEIEVD